MRFVLLIGELGLPRVKSFSGRCYLTDHIRDCSHIPVRVKISPGFSEEAADRIDTAVIQTLWDKFLGTGKLAISFLPVT